jgi:hypothetical protein
MAHVTTRVRREELRQWAIIQRVAAMVKHEPEFLGAFLIGSFAADSADFVSSCSVSCGGLGVPCRFKLSHRRRERSRPPSRMPARVIHPAGENLKQ